MLTYNGKPYARVSEILQPFTDFSSIDKEILERKASLGSRVHEAINQDIEGDLPVVGLKEAGYFQSFEIWRTAIKPIFVMSEKRLYCDKKMITGCVDALVKLEGEEKSILVDWKTSVSESPTWVMQAHLYAYLLEASGYPVGTRYLFIKLDKDGCLPKVFEYKFNSNVASRCFQAIDDFWTKSVAINQK